MNEHELVKKVAIAISGAPRPTTRSLNKARAALSVIREALSEPSEEMQNALIGAVRDGIAINDELAQRIAKETGAYYNQAQHALCVISEAGYDLVPRKLTMDMIVAGAEAVLIGGVPEEMSQRSYRAMIAASPIGKK